VPVPTGKRPWRESRPYPTILCTVPTAIPNPELAGDPADALPGRLGGSHGSLYISAHPRPPQRLPLRPGTRWARLDALLHRGALELGEHAHHLKTSPIQAETHPTPSKFSTE
jgi:hypothetical protein